MKRENKTILVCLMLAALLGLTAATSRPQLSEDEQAAVVESVIQTLDLDGLKESIVSTIENDWITKMKNAGYIGLASIYEATAEPTANTTPTATPTMTSTHDPNASPTPTRSLDDPSDYWEGAVLQDDGTYRGLHAKFANSYGYAVGSSDEGVTKEFKSVFVPNEVFTVDVVFENDGSVVWPARIEMRHVSNVGEYTGHTESAISDRTGNPVKPGDKCGFSISAHGSENLGDHTFFFKLYDADSGSAIEGGEGSFYYRSE